MVRIQWSDEIEQRGRVDGVVDTQLT